MNTDEQRIQAARGYLMLGMWQDAWDALDDLPVAWRTRDDVLHMRIEIYMGERHWESGRVLAESLVKRNPGIAQWWILWACCARRETSVADARAVLLEAASHHPDEPLIPYNLGCYYCVEGDIQTATVHLKKAFALYPRLTKTALDDPDLDAIFGKYPEEPSLFLTPAPQEPAP